MPYWRLFYHLVWSTKDREPLIDAGTEEIIRGELELAARRSEFLLHAIGAMPDHVHLVVSIPPSLAIATIVGRLKGASSRMVKLRYEEIGRDVRFSWQAEYGVISFAERHLDAVVTYVNHQKKHHGTDKLWHQLERLYLSEQNEVVSRDPRH